MMPRFFSSAAEVENEKVYEFVLTRPAGMWLSDQYPEPAMPDMALIDAGGVVPGTFRRKYGRTNYYTSAFTSGTASMGMHSFQRHSTTPQLLYSYAGTVYYGTAKTVVETGLTDNNFEFVTYNDVVYYVNGDNGLHSYNGTPTGAAVTAYTASGSEPANFLSDATSEVHNSKYIAVHDTVMYLAGPAAIPYRVYRADEVQGPTYIHNYVDLISGRGGKIVGMRSFAGVLVVFKEDSIWALDGLIGTHDFKRRVLHADIGCASGRSVADVPGLGLVFLASDGMFRVLRSEYAGGENVPLLSLSSHISGLVQYMDKSKFALAAGTYYGNMYRCVVYLTSTGTQGNEFMFDSTRVEAMPNDPLSLFVPWSVEGSVNLSVYADHYDGTNRKLIAGSVAGSGFAYILDDSAATGPTMTITTRGMHFGQPNRWKYLESVHAVVRSETAANNLDVSVSVDDAAYVALDTNTVAASSWGNNYLSIAQSKYTVIKIPVNKSGVRFRFKFTSSGNGGIEVTEFRFRYTMGGRR